VINARGDSMSVPITPSEKIPPTPTLHKLYAQIESLEKEIAYMRCDFSRSQLMSELQRVKSELSVDEIEFQNYITRIENELNDIEHKKRKSQLRTILQNNIRAFVIVSGILVLIQLCLLVLSMDIVSILTIGSTIFTIISIILPCYKKIKIKKEIRQHKKPERHEKPFNSLNFISIHDLSLWLKSQSPEDS